MQVFPQLTTVFACNGRCPHFSLPLDDGFLGCRGIYIVNSRFSDFRLFLLRSIMDHLLITILVILCLMRELDGLVAE